MAASVLLGTALLLMLASPWIRRRGRRHRAERDQRAAAEHRRLQLLNATDWAITHAVRTARDEMRTAPPFTVPPLRIDVADVVDRAHEEFNLQVPRVEAAVMLRHRLQFRGHAAVTDAYEDEEPQL